jgi:hypothetical protein
MKLKNGQLIIYEVKKEYLEYLSKYDNNVRQKSDRRYTGVLISDKDVDYCVPLTCQIKERNKKLTVNIKDKERTIAQLTINNMIPVKESVINIVDISNDKDKNYLNKEVAFLRKENNMVNLLKKAQYIQEVLFNPKSYDYNFFKKLCGNFELLEDKCIEYDRVKNIIEKLSYINNVEDLYYIYDSLNNQDNFENVVRLLDTPEDSKNISEMSKDEINDVLSRNLTNDEVTKEDIN